MSSDEIIDRMVLPDRIQVVCSPPYMKIIGDYDFFKNGYHKAKENNWIVTRPRNKKGMQFPTVNIPEELYNKQYPYISHITISLKKPYAVGMKFNVIRFIKKWCAETNPLLFNYHYDKKIRIHEDNYLDYTIFPFENSGIYDNMIKDVPYIIKTVSEQFVKELFGTVLFDYDNLSIKQIEFNVDNYVGENQSLEFFNKLIIFLHSDDGYIWRKIHLEEIALKEIKPDETEFQDVAPLEINEKLRTHYLFFEICKGMKLKIYRKTTDHIRIEVIYESTFIKRNFQSQQFDVIYDILYDKAKKFLQKSKFKQILKNLNMTPSYTIGCDNRMRNTYNFLGKLRDGVGLQEVYDAVYFGDPVVTMEGFQALNNNPDLKKEFVRGLSGTGQKVYSYNPEEAYNKRLERDQEKRMLNKLNVMI